MISDDQANQGICHVAPEEDPNDIEWHIGTIPEQKPLTETVGEVYCLKI